MAALSTFAELMARASATVFSQLYNNALEKAQQQALQQSAATGGAFPLLSPLLAMPPAPSISPMSIKSQMATEAVEKESPMMTEENGGRKRKRPVTEEESTQQVTPLLAIPVERQPSTSPLSGSRISSPDTISAHRARKLKLYAAEEKTDIIDYAKCIGNRAAGREFNVAESSIREWRKNEDKIRRQAETTAGCTQHFEKNRPDILADIDNQLVQILNAKEKRCSSWYGISEQAIKLWTEAAKKAELDAGEMKITMGWVARFMRRNEQHVPKIAPPIIATSNTATGGIGSPSMVRRSTILDTLPTPLETRSKTRNKAKVSSNNSQQETTLENGNHDVAAKESTAEKDLESGSSRRKRFRPMRVDDATLTTSGDNDAAAKVSTEQPIETGEETSADLVDDAK